MSKKRYHNTSTEKRETDQSSWQPKAYLTSKHRRVQNCHKSNRKTTGSRSAACDNADQTGYIRGQYIGENLSVTLLVTPQQKPCLVLHAIFLDFEKAFDSIEWNFLFKALDKLNFGLDFKNWVQAFYCNITSCVTNNGYACDFFNLERGVRQGHPLSDTLFVLGIKILALAIKKNPKIEGIRVGAREIKITQYADDTTVFLKTPESMSVLLDLLEKFERCSG